jgi:hypothetical protein
MEYFVAHRKRAICAEATFQRLCQQARCNFCNFLLRGSATSAATQLSAVAGVAKSMAEIESEAASP